MRIFYFFAPDRRGLNSYINEKGALEISLLQGKQTIGKVELEL
jgi:hypothetical protein